MVSKNVLPFPLNQSTYTPTIFYIVYNYLDHILLAHYLYGLNENSRNELCVFHFPFTITTLKNIAPFRDTAITIIKGQYLIYFHPSIG